MGRKCWDCGSTMMNGQKVGTIICYHCKMSVKADEMQALVDATPDGIGMNVAKRVTQDFIDRVKTWTYKDKRREDE